VARMTLFGRKGTREDETGSGRHRGATDVATDETRTQVDERDESDRRVLSREEIERRDEIERDARPATTTDPDRAEADDRTPVTTVERPAERVREVEARGRTSVTAVLALVVGLTGLYAALTGVLARPAIAVGVLGVIFAAVALARRTRRRVAGNGLAIFALILSLGAVVIGTAVATDSLPWLQGDTDQVMRIRDWIGAWLPWMVA